MIVVGIWQYFLPARCANLLRAYKELHCFSTGIRFRGSYLPCMFGNYPWVRCQGLYLSAVAEMRFDKDSHHVLAWGTRLVNLNRSTSVRNQMIRCAPGILQSLGWPLHTIRIVHAISEKDVKIVPMGTRVGAFRRDGWPLIWEMLP